MVRRAIVGYQDEYRGAGTLCLVIKPCLNEYLLQLVGCVLHAVTLDRLMPAKKELGGGKHGGMRWHFREDFQVVLRALLAAHDSIDLLPATQRLYISIYVL